MNYRITPVDVDRIREWLNCRVASVDAEGDVWVEDPMVGHWLSEANKQEFCHWREVRLNALRAANRRNIKKALGDED